jgi:hypothetical protein
MILLAQDVDGMDSELGPAGPRNNPPVSGEWPFGAGIGGVDPVEAVGLEDPADAE